jgi:ribosomal protein L40E
MSDILQSLSCPSCGGTLLTDKGDGTLSCPYCGAAFAHPDRVCPSCEAINELDARYCASCGEKLREPCARCGALNPVQASHCHQCGAALGVLEHIAARRAESTAERVIRLQASMPPLKEEAERASQERLEKMWTKDRARMEALAKAKAEQERQERLLWTIAALAIVALVIGIVALTVMAQLRAH